LTDPQQAPSAFLNAILKFETGSNSKNIYLLNLHSLDNKRKGTAIYLGDKSFAEAKAFKLKIENEINRQKGIFEKRANSKDIVFYNSYYCSKECISEYYSQHSENVIKKSQLEVKKDFLKEKRAMINYKVKLQNKVQEIARLIDHHLPCLARGKFGQMHGGHIYSKGSSPNCKFNLLHCPIFISTFSIDFQLKDVVRIYIFCKNLEKLVQRFGKTL
jgi:hypothetical protein